jgi:hypothetical protein
MGLRFCAEGYGIRAMALPRPFWVESALYHGEKIGDQRA